MSFAEKFVETIGTFALVEPEIIEGFSAYKELENGMEEVTFTDGSRAVRGFWDGACLPYWIESNTASDIRKKINDDDDNIAIYNTVVAEGVWFKTTYIPCVDGYRQIYMFMDRTKFQVRYFEGSTIVEDYPF